MTKHLFSPGINTLLKHHRNWVENKKIGLVSHAAAVDASGISSAELLISAHGVHLIALFGPEHGFWGTATAGEPVSYKRHPYLDIPVYSLFCQTKRPTARMLRGLDAIVFDLQDMGARPYTYVSTLRYLLEAASEQEKRVIIADRPIPLPSVTDGPVLDPDFESFIAGIRASMSYGMTPGETALWLKNDLGLFIDLKIAKMKNYTRQAAREPHWPPWIPPSPGILSWESGYCYTSTVFCEALPAIDNGRGTTLPFQLFGAPWMKSRQVCEYLSGFNLPGVTFHSSQYIAGSGRAKGLLLDGVRMAVINPDVFRPVTTSISIISCLQSLYGHKRIWQAPGANPDFFDKLFGTNAVRVALIDGEQPRVIAEHWRRGLTAFRKSRRTCLIYHKSETSIVTNGDDARIGKD